MISKTALLSQQIAENLVSLNARIANVIATRAPKSQHCQLVAVSKTKPVEDLVAAYEGG